jgi:membrane protease YdiL (CAAX protease family)
LSLSFNIPLCFNNLIYKNLFLGKSKTDKKSIAPIFYPAFKGDLMPNRVKTCLSEEIRSRLFLLIIGFAVFCGISQLSRFYYPLFGLVVMAGIAFPLALGGFTKKWKAMGFSQQNLGKALFWGICAGIVSSLAGLAVLQERAVVRDLGQQLLIGIPLWILVISPFQEFFFRGWMQSGLTEALGKWWGLVISTICFTVWHYLSPIVDLATFPLESMGGIISTFAAGLAFGYAFQMSKNIIAPWLGHLISGIVFIIIGAMDFVQVIQ